MVVGALLTTTPYPLLPSRRRRIHAVFSKIKIRFFNGSCAGSSVLAQTWVITYLAIDCPCHLRPLHRQTASRRRPHQASGLSPLWPRQALRPLHRQTASRRRPHQASGLSPLWPRQASLRRHRRQEFLHHHHLVRCLHHHHHLVRCLHLHHLRPEQRRRLSSTLMCPVSLPRGLLPRRSPWPWAAARRTLSGAAVCWTARTACCGKSAAESTPISPASAVVPRCTRARWYGRTALCRRLSKKSQSRSTHLRVAAAGFLTAFRKSQA